MDNSTIAAIATPLGSGGIGIIKISGPGSIKIAASVFRPIGGEYKNPGSRTLYESLLSAPTHHLHHGHIVDPENDLVLDEVLMALMRGPHSYTREDIVEIQAHSGPFVLRSILDLVVAQGARLAQPGEFTKRAFLNGRIDLTQAEAVIDIINAKTTASLNIATSHVNGALRLKIEETRHILLDILTQVEAAIDFPEEVGDVLNTNQTRHVISEQVISSLKELIGHYETAHYLRDGYKLAIVGSPNVGKSSLMNRLLNKDRSIVTSIPGTTRDLIEDTFSLNGFPVIISDTAGIHDTKDPVEIIGIHKARTYIEESDLILFVVDAASQLQQNDFKLFKALNKHQLVIVMNKIDLVNDNFHLDIPDTWQQIPCVRISALHDRGIDSLIEEITGILLGDMPDKRSSIVPNLRHKICLENSLSAAASVVDHLRNSSPGELIAIDLQEAIDALGEIVGDTDRVDVLDSIFSNFCIGK